ncbi:MAG: hypothetical protein LBU39_01895 [Desulfobulbaceae bacterium]|jgi:hypothetical protein|nr:hypothetical protein [Desulfobulbaceae bacterium]
MNEQTLLRRAGETLFGDRWKAGLAQALNIGHKTRIHQWLSPTDSKSYRPIPPGVWSEITTLLRQRAAAQIALADEMENQANQPACPAFKPSR